MLSVQKATSQVRRIVDNVMAGAMVSVSTRLSHDLATDTPLAVTVVSYPAGHAGEALMAMRAMRLAGTVKLDGSDSRLVITRDRVLAS